MTRTAIRDTSLDSWDAIQADGTLSRQERELVACLARIGTYPTRRELAKASGIDHCSVSGRVNSLVAAGIVIELPARKDRISGRMASPLMLRPAQRGMFA